MIEKVSETQNHIDSADERAKEIKKGIKFHSDYAKFKPIADEYSKKHFGRDKFKEEHRKELNSFYRAKRWIEENPKPRRIDSLKRVAFSGGIYYLDFSGR